MPWVSLFRLFSIRVNKRQPQHRGFSGGAPACRDAPGRHGPPLGAGRSGAATVPSFIPCTSITSTHSSPRVLAPEVNQTLHDALILQHRPGSIDPLVLLRIAGIQLGSTASAA